MKFLNNLRTKLYLFRIRYICNKPEVFANMAFRSVFKRDINWSNPTNLIEKIYWLQIYSDTALWTRCADKYLVREYVKEKGCEDILNELYGKWDSVDEIDWDALPDSFVLKTNNSCGTIIIVKDKNNINKQEINNTLNKWLSEKYGYAGSQLHYTKIKPCIIAEKLLVNKTDPEKALVDYKIWCLNGIPECVLIVFNRTQNNYSVSLYDLEWNNISERAANPNSTHFSGAEFPKPKSFEKMLESAKILSEGIPQVRMDFYDNDGMAVFGEMTFSTGFGSYSDNFYEYLGSRIDLSKVKKLEHPNKFVF